mmetsp:Transcript_110618/g.318021  ORF Transcript_110618/g.318021 Transcript_110618/m.318021 type:complete len:95 (-) Transcript_110618:65-349(-)
MGHPKLATVVHWRPLWVKGADTAAKLTQGAFQMTLMRPYCAHARCPLAVGVTADNAYVLDLRLRRWGLWWRVLQHVPGDDLTVLALAVDDEPAE